MGAFVKPLLARRYRVVAYDAPGHGEARGRTSSMPALAAALGAVARRFGPPAAVVAHSLGCTATIFALAQRELIVKRIVAVSPAARLQAIRERFGEMTGLTPPIVDRMRQALESRFGFDWDASEPLLIAQGMRVPLMVIHDAGDRFIPHEEGSELARVWPGGRLVTKIGLGHHRILRDPEVIDSVVEFISGSNTDSLLERKVS
jgi:pimeloyl-ACP methyl ester carboxylesterase